MSKIKQTNVSDLMKEIQRTENEINDHLLELGDRNNDDHAEYKKSVKNMFKGRGKKKHLLYQGLDEIGFDPDDASDYILGILVNWKK